MRYDLIPTHGKRILECMAGLAIVLTLAFGLLTGNTTSMPCAAAKPQVHQPAPSHAAAAAGEWLQIGNNLV